MSDEALAVTKNTHLWDLLGKTDPAHTKQFTRSGGFKGTAIKPMWCNLRMTEVFGACGTGWGMTEPQFQTRDAGEELMVFCTVGLWYIESGEKSQPVYGVGGDKYLIKGRDGSRTSDEAFKAAYTDALGNAMKFIGVAADVHMGLFDDSKYVGEMKEHFSDMPKRDPNAPPAPKLISKKDSEGLRALCNIAVEKGVEAKTIRETLQAFKFMNCGEVTEDKYLDVKAAIEGLA